MCHYSLHDAIIDQISVYLMNVIGVRHMFKSHICLHKDGFTKMVKQTLMKNITQ